MHSDMGKIIKSYRIPNEAILKKIEGRMSFFFDMNIWIDLDDRINPRAQKIKELLNTLIETGKAFCPLSDILIGELLKQQDINSLNRIANTMEKFSMNISYAPMQEIFHWETDCFCQKILGTKDLDTIQKILYVPIARCLLGSKYKIAYPEFYSSNQIDKYESEFQDRFSSLSLIDLLSMIRQAQKEGFPKKIESLKNYPDAMKDTIESRKDISGINKQKIYNIEERKALELYVLPYLKNKPSEFQQAFEAKLKLLLNDKDKNIIEPFFKFAPALQNHIEISVVSGLDPCRKTKETDFFDLEMIAIPLAYADAFVSQDTWLKDLVCNKGDFLSRNKCKYFSNLEDFCDFLISLR